MYKLTCVEASSSIIAHGQSYDNLSDLWHTLLAIRDMLILVNNSTIEFDFSELPKQQVQCVLDFGIHRRYVFVISKEESNE